MIESVLVPKDRVNVIKDKPTKDRIEKETLVKLSFEENSVQIDGEGLNLFTARNIVKAISRGFAPEKAYRLLNEDELFDVVDIDFETRKAETIRSRLIGTGGKTRRMIEEFSGSSVSIYGKTVCFIGKYEQIMVAKEAVRMLIEGASHAHVYKFLFDAKL